MCLWPHTQIDSNKNVKIINKYDSHNFLCKKKMVHRNYNGIFYCMVPEEAAQKKRRGDQAHYFCHV